MTLRDVRTSLLVVRANELAKSHRKQHSDEPGADASVTSECTTTDDSEATDVDTSECPTFQFGGAMARKVEEIMDGSGDDEEDGSGDGVSIDSC